MKKAFIIGVALSWCAAVFGATNQKKIDEPKEIIGKDARLHLQQLQAKHHRVFAEAARIMEARGYKPTNIVKVFQTAPSPARSAVQGGDPYIQRTQTTMTDGSGEVTLWSWDDGDPNTWEGVVYFEDYSTGANGTFNAQLDITTENFYSIWDQTVSYSSGSGGGCVDCKQYTSLERLPAAKVASMTPHGQIQLVMSRLQGWAWCSAGGCWGSAFSCIRTGPLWAECAKWSCLGVMVGCAINALK